MQDDPKYGEHSAARMDRVTRNALALVTVEPAVPTVMDIIVEWASDHGVGCPAEAIVALAERLREDRWRLAFAEDGALVGASVVEALAEQARLLAADEWPARNRLRILADQVEATLGAHGLL